MEIGLKRLVEEVVSGKWRGVTTEKLMEMVVRWSNLPLDRYFTPSPLDGDLSHFALYYRVQKTLKDKRIAFKIAGQRVSFRAVVNLQTGTSLDGSGYAREGVWIPFMALHYYELERLQARYAHRSMDASSQRVFMAVAQKVLADRPESDTIGDAWSEIMRTLKTQIGTAILAPMPVLSAPDSHGNV